MSVQKVEARRYCVQPEGTDLFIWLPDDCGMGALHYPYKIASNRGFGTMYSRSPIFVHGPCTLFVLYSNGACLVFHDSILGAQRIPDVLIDPPDVCLEADVAVGRRELLDNPFEVYPNMKPPDNEEIP